MRFRIYRLTRHLRRLVSEIGNKENPDDYLKNISGVIHIGANLGQERTLYNHYGLRVLWIEPIPEIFEKLQKNVKNFKYQRALCELITDIDSQEYEFHIANNDGQSSSILDFKQHKEVWPNIAFTRSIHLQSTTLTTLIKEKGIVLKDYQMLSMDTQGSELLILRGCRSIVKNFRYIQTEASDFEPYEGGCQLREIEEFMTEEGFSEMVRSELATHDSGGKHYDVVYQRHS